MDFCQDCSLPIDLCQCIEIKKKQIRIKEIRIAKRRYLTIVEGLINKKHYLSIFRRKFCCGGTLKNEHLELQGSHGIKIKDFLKEREINAEIILIGGF